ncbi:MAG: NADH:ubiquinone reductase (Na(+)-transporting) subunit B [Planctomycetes bacterium]|nr:NADH:ubiquinone reductase (Na(+)-transporting) subunit B [Planctomycetota bacterium]
MQFLRNLVENQKKLYHGKDSRFHKLWPLFDSVETFLFAPGHRAGPTGVHVRDYVDLKRVMNTVIIAMLPCLLWAFYNTGAQHFAAWASVHGGGEAAGDYVTGWLQAIFAPDVGAPSLFDKVIFGLQRMLPILVVSYGVGLGIEVFFSVIRKEEVSEGYLVSGMLIALVVPPSIPLWQLAVGVAFAVILGKEVFGGTGMNIFNPAMLVRAFLFFAFAAQMSGDVVWVAGNEAVAGSASHLVDGFSSPTALAVVKQYAGTDASTALIEHWSRSDLFFGNIAGSAGETSKFCVLLGAAYLLLTGIACWRIMLAGVLGLLGTAFAIGLVLPAGYGGMMSMAPTDHLLIGGFLFGIVFMATDPVSSPETNTGKWIYGALIGFVTILVRTINPAYPEGTMLSVLLLNTFAPTIDHFVVQANIKRRLARS